MIIHLISDKESETGGKDYIIGKWVQGEILNQSQFGIKINKNQKVDKKQSKIKIICQNKIIQKP